MLDKSTGMFFSLRIQYPEIRIRYLLYALSRCFLFFGAYMSYYPILVNLRGQKVVVVGGGKVAERKIETLLQGEAAVGLVSRDLSERLRQYVEAGKVAYLGETFVDSHLEGAFMVIAATDDPELNRRVSLVAKRQNLLVNAVDQPEDCNFIVPSILQRGDLIIAVSTSGKSPALARKIRQELEATFGDGYQSLLVMMGRLRKEVLSLRLSSEQNKAIFQKLVDSGLLKAVEKGNWDEAAAVLSKALDRTVSRDEVMDYLKAE
jgi:precorrin-2 dehydrogenase/sirohydrochlorin ferrochelatase